MKRTDYEGEYYRQYAAARILMPEAKRIWMDAVLKYAKGRTIRGAVDVGSGTGRFSPLLADALGAEVTGVEPSDQMRTTAEAGTRHPKVRFIKGSAESLPLGGGAFDLAWMSMVIHHVGDRAACARELARVLRPGGLVFIRNTFGDRLDEDLGIPLYEFFPESLEIDRRRLPTTAAITASFEGAGFKRVGFESIRQLLDLSLTAYLPRLRKGASSTLEQLTEAQREEGFRRMAEAAATESGDHPIFETIDMLVFERR